MKYLAGQVLGRYELLVPIAQGGMAQVWAARLRGSRGFQKIVAIKTIRPGTTDHDRMEAMFLEEAKIASQIQHPNVVGTMELGDHEGTLYLVMEWVEGESLKQIMKRSAARGGIPIPIAVNLIAQACKGLHAAHELRDETGNLLGVVHRDITPHNILVTYGGTAKLLDFGVAKVAGRDAELTEAGELKGKFGYMAPELVSGGNIDRRADIFGMGIVLALLTTGHHPFQGDHPAQMLQNICVNPPRAPSSLVKGYPAELEQVVLKALHKNPDERWATADDMLIALETAMPGCLDRSFEDRVAEFMGQLFGETSRERRAELRIAHELADHALAESPPASASSVRSLRAVSVDRSGTTPSATLHSMRTGDSPPPSVRVSASRRSHPSAALRWLAATGVACGIVVALSFVNQMHPTWLRGAAATRSLPMVPMGMTTAPPTATASLPPAIPTTSAAAPSKSVAAMPTAASAIPTSSAAPTASAASAPRPKVSPRPKDARPSTVVQPQLPEPAPQPEGASPWDRRF